MAKKQFFMIVDTETSITDKVADFAAVIVDRRGNIQNQMACLVSGVFGIDDLFYNKSSPDEIWTLKGLEIRNQKYSEMLNTGERMMASVNGINKWLAQAKNRYPDLIFTAYNSIFDLGKMSNTGIDTEFKNKFCMMRAAQNRVMNNKAYYQHCLDRKWFTAKLQFRTNAEAMAEFVEGGELPAEPHTALEDILDYELPIFKWLLLNTSWKNLDQKAYNWREWQLKELVSPK